MGGKTWSWDEEKFFWEEIVPRSPKAVKRSGRVKDWGECAKIMQQAMGPNARRKYTKLMLFEHYFQNVQTGHKSPRAREFVIRHKRELAGGERSAPKPRPVALNTEDKATNPPNDAPGSAFDTPMASSKSVGLEQKQALSPYPQASVPASPAVQAGGGSRSVRNGTPARLSRKREIRPSPLGPLPVIDTPHLTVERMPGHPVSYGALDRLETRLGDNIFHMDHTQSCMPNGSPFIGASSNDLPVNLLGPDSILPFPGSFRPTAADTGMALEDHEQEGSPCDGDLVPQGDPEQALAA